MSQNAIFAETISRHLPATLSASFEALLTENNSTLEDVLRFTYGAETASDGHPWEDRSRQEPLRKALDALLKPADLKRRREAVDDSQSSKRPRLGGDIEDDGAPQYIIHAVSATSPVRRKVDLMVTQSSLKVLNSTSQAVEAVVSLADLKRAFILPTRGKTKPHWTVVVLSKDTQDKSAPSPQIIFGLDASVTTPLSVSSPEKTVVKKGEPTLAYLHIFLSHFKLPNPIYETDTTVFKSSVSKEPIAGTEAYLGAKVGSLWFLKDGVLWGESKPCEFWPADEILDIRIISATGRQCSATLIRRMPDYDEGEETAFTFIDGREQDGISQWVRKYRKIPVGAPIVAEPVPAGPLTINSLALESDDEDEDFEDKYDDNEEDNTSSEQDPDDGDGEQDASGEDDDEHEEELKPENHPLMRPGAMPKMSKAMMDVVVGMVEDDLMGGDEVDELED